MEKQYVRVGGSTSSGKLDMEKQALMELYEQGYYELISMSKGLEYCRKSLALADFCYQNGLDSEACDLYHRVFRSFSWECKGIERELFEQALHGLSALCSSDDECVWERCSQVVGDYMIWKREQEEQK